MVASDIYLFHEHDIYSLCFLETLSGRKIEGSSS